MRKNVKFAITFLVLLILVNSIKYFSNDVQIRKHGIPTSLTVDDTDQTWYNDTVISSLEAKDNSIYTVITQPSQSRNDTLIAYNKNLEKQWQFNSSSEIQILGKNDNYIITRIYEYADPKGLLILTKFDKKGTPTNISIKEPTNPSYNYTLFESNFSIIDVIINDHSFYLLITYIIVQDTFIRFSNLYNFQVIKYDLDEKRQTEWLTIENQKQISNCQLSLNSPNLNLLCVYADGSGTLVNSDTNYTVVKYEMNEENLNLISEGILLNSYEGYLFGMINGEEFIYAYNRFDSSDNSNSLEIVTPKYNYSIQWNIPFNYIRFKLKSIDQNILLVFGYIENTGDPEGTSIHSFVFMLDISNPELGIENLVLQTLNGNFSGFTISSSYYPQITKLRDNSLVIIYHMIFYDQISTVFSAVIFIFKSRTLPFDLSVFLNDINFITNTLIAGLIAVVSILIYNKMANYIKLRNIRKKKKHAELYPHR